MKTINIASITAGLTFLLIAQGGELPARGETCEASIQELKRLIISKGGLVSGIKYEDLGARSPFSNASELLYIGLEHKPWQRMGGNATPEQDRVNQNLAYSPSLLLPYAMQIINSCEKVITVVVNYHEWGPSFSLHKDKVIREDKCAEPEMGIEPPWGYRHCL
jgi:hypothetical protein